MVRAIVHETAEPARSCRELESNAVEGRHCRLLSPRTGQVELSMDREKPRAYISGPVAEKLLPRIVTGGPAHPRMRGLERVGAP